jgi:hypothetical protein
MPSRRGAMPGWLPAEPHRPGDDRRAARAMDMLEADPAVKVVVFDSADEEYFIAYFDVAHGELPGPGRAGLPALAGRSRTLEIILGSEDFDADTWVSMTWDPQPGAPEQTAVQLTPGEAGAEPRSSQ